VVRLGKRQETLLVRLPRVFMVRHKRGSGVAVTNGVSYELLQAELELATREPT
jgi:hypothetical protein